MFPHCPSLLFAFLGIIAASIVFRLYKGKPVLWPTFANARFSERWVTGASLKWGILGWLTGARNGLWVAVIDDELWIGPRFPSNLMFLPEIFGTDCHIRGADILELEVGPSVIDGIGFKGARRVQRVRITFQKPNGRTQRYEIWTKDVEAFREAVSQIANRAVLSEIGPAIDISSGASFIRLRRNGAILITAVLTISLSIFAYTYVRGRYFGGSAEHLPPKQQKTVAALKAVGAWVEIPKEVVSVDLSSMSKIGSHRVTDRELIHLKELPHLVAVNLGGSKAITDAGLKELAELKGLESLELMRTNISDAGLEHLKELNSLRSLGLLETQITDAGLAHLENLTNLQSLDLGGTQITDEGLKHFHKMAGLTGLSFNHCRRFNGSGLRHLPSLSHLVYLSASDTMFHDAGMKHLKDSTDLETLYLDETRITDTGLMQLQRLTKLTHVRVIGTNVTRSGKNRLGQALEQRGLQKRPRGL